MKKVWYRKQSLRFRDINASPNRPAFFSDDFDYMTLFGDDMQRPKVFVVFLDENTPVFDVWKDSVEKLCGYPAPCEEFLQGDALETMTYCLDKFLEMIGDRPNAETIRLVLKKLDESYVPVADIAKATDAELLEFAEWAAQIVKRASAKGVPPYKVVIDDMIQAKPGIKGIIDGPGSLMSIDPNIQSSVAYELFMREVNWLSNHRMDDMQSDDPVRVRTAIDAYRRRYGMPAQLKEDKEQASTIKQESKPMKKLAESVIYNDEDVVISTDILDRLAEDEEVKDICIKRMKQLKMNDEIEGLEHGGVEYKKGYLQLKVFIGNVLEQVISKHSDELMAETKKDFIVPMPKKATIFSSCHESA